MCVSRRSVRAHRVHDPGRGAGVSALGGGRLRRAAAVSAVRSRRRAVYYRAGASPLGRKARLASARGFPRVSVRALNTYFAAGALSITSALQALACAPCCVLGCHLRCSVFGRDTFVQGPGRLEAPNGPWLPPPPSLSAVLRCNWVLLGNESGFPGVFAATLVGVSVRAARVLRRLLPRGGAGQRLDHLQLGAPLLSR